MPQGTVSTTQNRPLPARVSVITRKSLGHPRNPDTETHAVKQLRRPTRDAEARESGDSSHFSAGESFDLFGGTVDPTTDSTAVQNHAARFAETVTPTSYPHRMDEFEYLGPITDNNRTIATFDAKKEMKLLRDFHKSDLVSADDVEQIKEALLDLGINIENKSFQSLKDDFGNLAKWANRLELMVVVAAYIKLENITDTDPSLKLGRLVLEYIRYQLHPAQYAKLSKLCDDGHQDLFKYAEAKD